MKQKILPVMIVLLLSFLAGEATVRIFHFFHPLFIFYDDSYNRFRGKPFAPDFDFKLNSLGFKDTEFSQQKHSRFRIAAIGDSFSYGVVPYKDNYLTLLESQLKGQGIDAEVCNLGIPSTGPKDYLAVLEQEGLRLHPDMVLLSFFIGNDFSESGRKKKWHEYSCLASLLRYLLAVRPKYEGQIVHGAGAYCDDCPSFAASTYLDIEKTRSSIYLTDNAEFPVLLAKALDYLAQIQDICAEKNISLSVALIPDEVQINAKLQEQVRAQFATGKSGWNILLPNQQLQAGLKKMRIDFLDLYPAFAEQAKTKQLYRPRDTHWNIAGNQLAADLLQQHLHSMLTFLPKNI